MTKLALYDKHEAGADRAASEYFRHDYIYKKNLGTRFAVGIAGFLMLALYWGRVFLLDGADILQMDVRQYLTASMIFLVALLALFSLIGTIKGTREYYLIQKRLDGYNVLIRQLEKIEAREEAHIHRRDSETRHGTDSVSTRDIS